MASVAQSRTPSVAPTLQRFVEAQRGSGMLLLWAVATGALAGLVGGLFRLSVVSLSSGLHRMAGGISEQGMPGWVFPLFSTAALVALAAWLVQRFAPEARGSGVQEIEGALDRLRPVRWARVLPVKFVGGVLSLGAGMVMGREGPTIQMGGAVGRMLSDLFRRSDDDAHTLVAAGAGAGLAAAFNAPLAGMLFVIEEMRPQFHYSVVSVQCVVVACATADIVVKLVVGSELVIPMGNLATPAVSSMWIFLLLGSIFGLLGLAFNITLLAILDLFDRVPPAARWLAAGLVGAGVGVLGWLNADLVGGGYRSIADALAGRVVTTGLLLLCGIRFFLTLVCFASGPPGGIFAPMLALGTLLGLGIGNFVEAAFPGSPEAGVFVVAGMGALFSATVRAPITGIVLAAELTGSYAQIPPIAIACAAATVVAHRLGGQPIYTVLLERALRASASSQAGEAEPEGDRAER